MRGVIILGLSVLSVFFFSICLFLSDNLLLLWLFMELGSLALIPSFFMSASSGTLSSLFNYILVSGVSSSLIISGLMMDGYSFLIYVGLLVKFGVFPFMGWIYAVVASSNWLIAWLLSTALKSSFFFFSFFLSSGWDNVFLCLVCIFTFLCLTFLIWVNTPSWLVYWCHVLVGSSAALVLMALEVSPDILFALFFVYFGWATVSIVVLMMMETMSVDGGFEFFLILGSLVSFPFSVALYYKILIGYCMFSCGSLAFGAWILFNLSEQFFLVKYLMSIGLPRSQWNGGRKV